MSKPKITYDDHYRGYKIWKDYKQNSACRCDILDCGIDMLEIMRERRMNFMFIRWDLHYPANIQYPLNCKNISSFNKDLKAYCEGPKRKRKLLMEYLWRRQHEPGCLNYHIHYATIFDGNFISNNPYGVLKSVVTPIWLNTLGLPYDAHLVHYCDGVKYNDFRQNGIFVNRFDDDSFRECVRWMSYLARVSKFPDHIMKYGNTWGSSGFKRSTNSNLSLGV